MYINCITNLNNRLQQIYTINTQMYIWTTNLHNKINKNTQSNKCTQRATTNTHNKLYKCIHRAIWHINNSLSTVTSSCPDTSMMVDVFTIGWSTPSMRIQFPLDTRFTSILYLIHIFLKVENTLLYDWMTGCEYAGRLLVLTYIWHGMFSSLTLKRAIWVKVISLSF